MVERDVKGDGRLPKRIGIFCGPGDLSGKITKALVELSAKHYIEILIDTGQTTSNESITIQDHAPLLRPTMDSIEITNMDPLLPQWGNLPETRRERRARERKNKKSKNR